MMRTFTSPTAYAAAMRAFHSSLTVEMGRAMKNIGSIFVGTCKQVMTAWIYERPIPTKRKHRVGLKSAYIGPKGFLRGYKYRAFKSDKIEWHLTGPGSKKTPKGRGLWTRTGSLGRSERFRELTWHGWAVMIWNAASYAYYRHWLRHTRFPGMVMAPAPWRNEALDRTRAYRRQRVTDAIWTAIKARLA